MIVPRFDGRIFHDGEATLTFKKLQGKHECNDITTYKIDNANCVIWDILDNNHQKWATDQETVSRGSRGWFVTHIFSRVYTWEPTIHRRSLVVVEETLWAVSADKSRCSFWEDWRIWSFTRETSWSFGLVHELLFMIRNMKKMIEMNSGNYDLWCVHIWLVVDLPLWKIWLRQLGWLNCQYMET